MIKIYHNPRCSKSRQGLEILKDSGKEFEIRDYLKEPLNQGELKEILKKLNMIPIEIIRTDEKVWKENYRGRDLSDDELIEVIVKHPRLIQRPIVVKEGTAVVGRPPSRISELLN